MENSEIKKQWHGPFCSAVRLELVENKGDVDFQNEYNLSSKPLQIDLLVIKKTEEVSINNEIGKIFRGHNLMEYKSPGDGMNIDTYYKVLGYACFYKANGHQIDAVREDDITISFVREGYPRELFRYFRERRFAVEKKYPGIYYVRKEGFFPMQVIVSGELNKELHIWLTSLTRNLKTSAAETLVYRIGRLKEKDEQMNASAVLNLAMEANREVFEKVKEENPMFEELQKLMKPHTDKIVQEAVKEAVQENTGSVIDNMIKKFGVSLEDACDTVGITLEQYQQIKEKQEKKKLQSAEEQGSNES